MIPRLLRAFQWAAGALAVLASDMPARAADISTGSPLLFRFVTDPQVLVFGAGNDAAGTFVTTAPVNRANLSYNQDIYPSAQRLNLWDSTYDFSPFASDARSTESAEYWRRLQGHVGGAAFLGDGIDCRITTELLMLVRTQPNGLRQYAKDFAGTLRDRVKPLLSVDLETRDALEVLRAFRESWPELLVGRVLRTPEHIGVAPQFDFAIAYEEAVPPTWRGQTAVAYLHQQIGQKPVIMATELPNFYQELFWLSTDAAGLQHDDLPSLGTPSNKTAWHNLRATTGFLKKFGGDVRPAPMLLTPEIVGAFATRKGAFYLFPRTGTVPDYPLPTADPEFPEYIAGWYNPVTDQAITMPRKRRAGQASLHLKQPSSARWIYWHVPLPAMTDEESTTTLILPEPPEPEYPDETTTGT